MQPTTERMTRSRARTLAATGQTPALGALPSKTPATTRTTRRRAAVAAASPSETEGAVAPVVLFDVTNEQTGSPAQQPLTARDAPAAAPQPTAATAAPEADHADQSEPAEEPVLPSSPAPAAAAGEPAVPASPTPPAEEPSADEPPATPATTPASPAPPAPGTTPTGLGLSTLLPLSPSPPLAFQIQSATPAATPLAGLEKDHQSKVADALAAAVEALGGASPVAAASAAPTAGQGGDAMFRGFGSPLKQEEGGSPAMLPAVPVTSSGPSVSIGAAIGAAEALMSDDAMSSPAPGVGLEMDDERELTLEEMMGTPPGASDCEDSPAAAGAPAATPGVRVRTAAKVYPLTPARQVVLEEEEQDYIMQTDEGFEGEAAVAAPSSAPTPSPGPAVQPSPAPSTALGLSPAVLYLAPNAAASPAPALAAAVPTQSPAAQHSLALAAEGAREAAAHHEHQPRIGSKVVLPSPDVYDPRSLRQLKREVAERLAVKQAEAPDLFADDEDVDDDGEYIGTSSGDDLAEELGALSLEGGNKLLRGLPTPAGTHIRFDEEGDVTAVSPRQRVYLRGVPQPAGTHIKFDN